VGTSSVHRIVSLIPSATEIVCALGCESGLVGRSHECDFPLSVKRLPVCTEPKFNPEGTSYQIDQRVKAILQEALSVYRVDAEKMRALNPDVIITQSQCEVCAVNLRDVEQLVCEWMSSRPRIVSLSPCALDDVWADIRRVAEALEARARGEELLGQIESRMGAIAERSRALGERPTIACIEWIDPLMAAGNWMPALVEMAGGVNLFGESGRHSPWMEFAQLQDRDPDVILLAPCGFDMNRTRQELSPLVEKAGWASLKAVREQRVFLADGNQYFNRPGPRLAESLEILAEMLHPRAFRFGHEGGGWQRV